MFVTLVTIFALASLVITHKGVTLCSGAYFQGGKFSIRSSFSPWRLIRIIRVHVCRSQRQHMSTTTL